MVQELAVPLGLRSQVSDHSTGILLELLLVTWLADLLGDEGEQTRCDEVLRPVKCLILLQCIHSVEWVFSFVMLIQISMPTLSHATEFAVQDDLATINKKCIKLNLRLLTRIDYSRAS